MKDTKETASFSISSRTIEALEICCELCDYDNRSRFVEKAIKDRIARKLSENPLAWVQIYKAIKSLSL